jgi:hypothetical protein
LVEGIPFPKKLPNEMDLIERPKNSHKGPKTVVSKKCRAVVTGMLGKQMTSI